MVHRQLRDDSRANAARQVRLQKSLDAAHAWNPAEVSVLQFNAHSLNATKAPDLAQQARATLADVILISEVWQRDDAALRLLSEQGYATQLKLREELKRKGGPKQYGGVGVCYKSDRYSASVVDCKWTAPGFEILVLELKSKYDDAPPLRVAAIYWPPNSDGKVADFEDVMKQLASFIRRYKIDIVGGDWNAYHPSWDPSPVIDPTSRVAARGRLLADLIAAEQVELAAPPDPTFTRVEHGKVAHEAILDFLLVGSDTFGQIGDSHSTRTNISDHSFVNHTLYYTDCTVPLCPPSSTDGPVPSRSLNVNWSKATDEEKEIARSIIADGLAPYLKNTERLLSSTPEQLYRLLEPLIYSAMDVLPRVRKSKPSPLPRELELVRNQVLEAWNKVAAFARANHHAHDDDLVQTALTASKLFKQKCKTFAEHHYASDPRKSCGDPNEAWRVLDRYLRPVAASVPLTNPDGGPDLSTNKEQAEAFLKIFVKKQELSEEQREAIAAKERKYAEGHEFAPSYRCTDRLSNVAIPSFEEVRSAIKAHDISKCPDFNGFDARLLQMLPPAAIEYFRYLFGVCIHTGKMPSQWRDSVVIPLHKAGKPANELKSYRPVAITSLICRTYERVVFRRITERLQLSPEQFGFRAGSGTTHPLVAMSLFVNDAFGNDASFTTGTGKKKRTTLKQFRALELGLDFSDAFCRISPDHVAEQYLKVRRKSGEIEQEDFAYARMVHDFMMKRRMAVRMGTAMTGFARTDIGAPQGTILGPLLWSLACEHIIEKVKEKLPAIIKKHKIGFWTESDVPRKADMRTGIDKSIRDQFALFLYYADDSAILMASCNLQAIAAAQQEIAAVVAEAATELGLAVSPKSTASVFMKSDKDEDEDAYIAKTSIKVTQGVDLKMSTDPHKMLGLTFDSNGSYATFVEQRIAIATKYINIIKKLRCVLSPATTRSLYVGKVLSILLYGVDAWGSRISPTLWNSLEIVHREGARLITGCIASTESSALLAEAGLLPLRVIATCRAHEFVQTLIRRPDDCPAKQRFLLKPMQSKKYASEADKHSLRTWCPVEPGVLREPIPAYERPLYSFSETQPAVNVHFDLDRGLPGKKEDHEVEDLLAANLKMYKTIEATGERLEILSDGSCTTTDDDPVDGHDPNVLRKSGAAAMIFHVAADGARTLLETKKMRCGERACIFTAEAHGVDMGLELAVKYRAIHPTLPMHFITDSLSNAMRLERGPCDQKEWMAVKAWQKLLVVAADAPFTFHFAYSHCDWKLQDQIDDEAKAALECMNDPPPIWHKDEANHYTTAVRQFYADSVMNKATCSWRWKLSGVKIMSKPLLLPWNDAKTIHRLRCGVEPEIGGWKRNLPISEHCAHCHKPISADKKGLESGIEHFFTCPSMKQCRQQILGIPDDDKKHRSILLDDDAAPKILAYWRRYTNKPSNNDDDSDDDTSSSSSSSDSASARTVVSECETPQPSPPRLPPPPHHLVASATAPLLL